jgi:endonuclease-3
MTKKAETIINVLNEMFPNAKAELNHKNPFELLVAVVLSAQTTDIQVNKVTENLFKKYPSPKALSEGEIRDIEHHLKSIGLYRNKATFIKELATILVANYNSEVPSNRSDLESLPGVGRKTANVVLSNAFGIPAFAVDTHVSRVSKRLGIAKPEDNVEIVEQKLNKMFPKEYWLKLHHQLIFFGRYHCLAKSPKCYECPLYDMCVFEEKAAL